MQLSRPLLRTAALGIPSPAARGLASPPHPLRMPEPSRGGRSAAQVRSAHRGTSKGCSLLCWRKGIVLRTQPRYPLVQLLCLPAAEPAASRPVSGKGCASGDRRPGSDQECLGAMGFALWFCTGFVFSFPVQPWSHSYYLKTLVLEVRV